MNAEGQQPAFSLIGISSGGFIGKGIGQGLCKFSLAESHNDYIFPTVVEELGFIGGIILIALFFMLFYYGFKICQTCKNTYGKNLAFGALFVIMIEFFMNIMVALNMMPSTGVCLPFISCGGSATTVNLWLAGIIISVSRQRNFTDEWVSPDIKTRKGYKILKTPTQYNPFEKHKMYIKNKDINND